MRSFQAKIHFIRRHYALQTSFLSLYYEKWVIEELDHAEESCSFCLCVMEILLLEGVTAELVTGLFEPETPLAEKWSNCGVWLPLHKQSKWEMLLLKMRKVTFTQSTFLGGWNSIAWVAAAKGFPRHLCFHCVFSRRQGKNNTW